MMKVIDNFLPKQVLELVKENIDKVDWYVGKTNSYDEHITFTHGVNFDNNYIIKDISKIISSYVAVELNLPIKNLIRVRWGAIHREINHIIHEKHIDVLDNPHVTALLYLNDSDGDTYFYDNDGNIESNVTPKENRLVTFDGSVLHSSSTPLKTQLRYAINFNFMKEE